MRAKNNAGHERWCSCPVLCVDYLVEEILETVEEGFLLGVNLIATEFSEALEEFALFLIEVDGGFHDNLDELITTRGVFKAREALATESEDLARLCACGDAHVYAPFESGDVDFVTESSL